MISHQCPNECGNVLYFFPSIHGYACSKCQSKFRLAAMHRYDTKGDSWVLYNGQPFCLVKVDSHAVPLPGELVKAYDHARLAETGSLSAPVAPSASPRTGLGGAALAGAEEATACLQSIADDAAALDAAVGCDDHDYHLMDHDLLVRLAGDLRTLCYRAGLDAERLRGLGASPPSGPASPMEAP